MMNKEKRGTEEKGRTSRNDNHKGQEPGRGQGRKGKGQGAGRRGKDMMRELCKMSFNSGKN